MAAKKGKGKGRGGGRGRGRGRGRPKRRVRHKSRTIVLSEKGGEIMIGVPFVAGSPNSPIDTATSPLGYGVRGQLGPAVERVRQNLSGVVNPGANFAASNTMRQGALVLLGGKVLKALGIKSPSVKIGKHRLKLWG